VQWRWFRARELAVVMTESVADASAIADIRERFETSENSGDIDATAELLADDAVLIVPDYPVQEGKPAILGFLREISGWLLARFDRHVTYVSTEVEVVGDMAFDRGTFAFDVTRKSGGPITHVAGKYLWLLRRDDARWKMSRIIVTRDDEPESEGDAAARSEGLILYRQLLDAWNARNAAAFAEVFSEDASVVGFDGSPMNGRAEIASALEGIFRSHQTARYMAIVRDIRQIGPDVLLVRSVVGMVPPGKAELNPTVNAIQSVVAAGRGADMRVALLHNTPAAFHGRPELAEQLTRELTDALSSGRTVTA
jgi:uncharacterized protein (TIGR02246 family)